VIHLTTFKEGSLKYASPSNLPRYVVYWDGKRVVSVKVYEACGDELDTIITVYKKHGDGFTQSFMPKNGSGSIGLFGLPHKISDIPKCIKDIFNVSEKDEINKTFAEHKIVDYEIKLI